MVLFNTPEGMKPSRKTFNAERGARWVMLAIALFLGALMFGAPVPVNVFLILATGLVSLFPAAVIGQGVTDARVAKHPPA